MAAIIWRELKVALTSVLTLVAQFIAPIFILVFFATAFSNNIGRLAMSGTGSNYLEFFAPGLFGYVSFLLFGFSSAFIRIDRQTGMLAIIALSRTSLYGYYWGKMIVQITLAFVKIFILMIIAFLLIGHLPKMPLSLIPLFSLTIILGVIIWYSMGIFIGVVVQRSDMREIILILVTLPLTFASSMYYETKAIPEAIRWIAVINPLTYICNIMRGCYLGTLPMNYFIQTLLLIGYAAVIASISILALKKVRLTDSTAI